MEDLINTNHAIAGKLDRLISMMEKMQSEEIKQLMLDVEELKYYRIETQAASKARRGLINALIKDWSGFFALIGMALLALIDLMWIKKG